MIVTVALIILFGKNSESSGSGGDKSTNKPDIIVSLHLADDSNNYSDDDDESVGSFESKDLHDGRASNDDLSTIDVPTTASELENDNINDSVVTDDDDRNKDHNNEVDTHPSDNNNDDSSKGKSVSDNVTTCSVTSPKKGDSSALHAQATQI